MPSNPDAAHRAELVAALDTAATALRVTPWGSAAYGWHDRTIGSRVHGADGDGWLRVQTAPLYKAHGKLWEGNAAAGAIRGVAKPDYLASYIWTHDDLRFRADLFTLVTSPSCSLTPELRSRLELSDHWWARLRRSLDRLADQPTERISVRQELITRRLHARFGERIDPVVTQWSTAHGDVHWANLTQPDLWLLDWEGWGRAPLGLDAAFLYCFSLLQPEVAGRVHNVFADLLDAPEGVRAQLFAVAELLIMVERGDHPDLALPLLGHADVLLRAARRSA